MSNAPTVHNDQPALQGAMLWVGAVVLALANFIAVLNMTIANVTEANMAGALGAGSSQGTWIITAYAVAEAITVPLTGWLSARFGAVKVFSLSVVMFAIASWLCGLSVSLNMLLAMRVLQGMAGGPLLALSQTLLLRIFPKEKAMQAMGLWAMTTLETCRASRLWPTIACVLLSSALVASSRKSMRGLRTMARAMRRRWR